MGHHDRVFSFALIEADYAPQGDTLNWDAEGWVGGDAHKFWWKSEGEHAGGRTERAEVQALYSRNAWTFVDVQAGLRYDAEPDSRGYAVIGAQGLLPYLLEAELHAFIGFEGDVSIRFKQSFDLLITNRFILEPSLETDLYLTDARGRGVASGFSSVEAGVAARYEISRKFAPYAALIYERDLGGTARLTRAAGEDVGGWSLRAGVRLWF